MILFAFVWARDYARPWFGLFTEAQGFDKLAHAGGAALALLILYRATRWVLERHYNTFNHDNHGKAFHYLATINAFLWVLVGGLTLEIWQGFTDPWGFSFMDMVANFIGALIAMGALNHAHKRRG